MGLRGARCWQVADERGRERRPEIGLRGERPGGLIAGHRGLAGGLAGSRRRSPRHRPGRRAWLFPRSAGAGGVLKAGLAARASAAEAGL